MVLEHRESAQPQARVKSERVLVRGGDYMMGALPNDKTTSEDEHPRHRVTIGSSLEVVTTEITQGLYQAVMGHNPSKFRKEDHPVEQVSWYDAITFANTLSRRCDLDEAYTINGKDVSCNWSANGWRLPTEAEWEYLARGGEEHLYSGSDDTTEVAWFRDNTKRKPIKSHRRPRMALACMT